MPWQRLLPLISLTQVRVKCLSLQPPLRESIKAFLEVGSPKEQGGGMQGAWALRGGTCNVLPGKENTCGSWRMFCKTEQAHFATRTLHSENPAPVISHFLQCNRVRNCSGNIQKEWPDSLPTFHLSHLSVIQSQGLSQGWCLRKAWELIVLSWLSSEIQNWNAANKTCGEDQWAYKTVDGEIHCSLLNLHVWKVVQPYELSLRYSVGPSIRHLPLYLLYWRWFLWFTDNWNSCLLWWSINLAVTTFMAMSIWHNILAMITAGKLDMLREGKHYGIAACLIWNWNKSLP